MRQAILTAALVLAGLAAVALPASGAPDRAAEDRLLEEITVPAEASATSDTKLQGSETYKLVFSGGVHLQCKGDAFESVWDEDAFYLYNFTDRGHPNSSSPAGGSFFQYTGKPVFSAQPAYSTNHAYTLVLRPPHVIGHIVFRDSYHTDHQHCARTGKWTVTIWRVGGGTAPTGVTIPEPAPGGSDTVEGFADYCGSEAFRLGVQAAEKQCQTKVGVTDSAGDFSKTTIVGIGERTRAQATGEAVATCWLLGPDVLRLDTQRLLKDLKEGKDIKGKSLDDLYRSIESSPINALVGCMLLVSQYLDTSRSTSGAGTSQAAAGVCRAQRLGLAFRVRGGNVVSVRSAPLTAGSIRYRCTASGGKMTITISGSNLRAQLGPRVRLGVYRSKHAPRRKARLTFKAVGGGAVTPRPPSTPPSPSAATFRLQPSLTKMTNTHSSELTIDPAAMTAVENHCCDGGGWKVDYSWKVPATITPGKSYALTLRIKFESVNPNQPLGMQMNALAPDFAQAIQAHWPDTPDVSKTFTVPLAASQKGSSDIAITIGFVSSGVTYHYRK